MGQKLGPTQRRRHPCKPSYNYTAAACLKIIYISLKKNRCKPKNVAKITVCKNNKKSLQ